LVSDNAKNGQGDAMYDAVYTRSGGACELCRGVQNIQTFEVASGQALIVCGVCLPQLVGEIADSNHWRCLQGSIWSEVAAVQALSWWMLSRLKDQPWAHDALSGAFLESEVLTMAQALFSTDNDDVSVVVDGNGARLQDGDSVTLIKDLEVKGAKFTAKRGTMVKNIRLGTDPTHVEGRVNKMSIMLKTCFLKRVNG
jgi:protein PhnA